MKKIPSEKDWENYRDDLDVNHAYKMFAGKTNDELQIAFKENVMEMAFDIGLMPLVPFQYYIFAYKQHIDSENFGLFSMPDAVSCFIGLIEDKVKNQPEYVKPILPELLPTLKRIATNQDDFEADIDIYGDFEEKLNFILKAMKR